MLYRSAGLHSVRYLAKVSGDRSHFLVRGRWCLSLFIDDIGVKAEQPIDSRVEPGHGANSARCLGCIFGRVAIDLDENLIDVERGSDSRHGAEVQSSQLVDFRRSHHRAQAEGVADDHRRPTCQRLQGAAAGSEDQVVLAQDFPWTRTRVADPKPNHI